MMRVGKSTMSNMNSIAQNGFSAVTYMSHFFGHRKLQKTTGHWC